MSLQNRPNDAGNLFQVLWPHQVRHLSTIEDVVDVLCTKLAAVAWFLLCHGRCRLPKDMLRASKQLTRSAKADTDTAIFKIKVVAGEIVYPPRKGLSDMHVGYPVVHSFVEASGSACRLPDHDTGFCTGKIAVLGSPPLT